MSSGCSSRQKSNLEYETKVIEVTYEPVDCGDLKLKHIGIQQENPNLPAGSYENQKIISSNLILMHYKLKEAETLINCYRNQIKKN